MRRLAAVIFDLDGTLSVPVYDFTVLRQRLQDRFPGRFVQGDLLDEIDQLVAHDQEEAEEVVHVFEREGRDLFAFQEGAVDLLHWLDAKSVPRALITRNTRVSIDLLNEELVEKHNVAPFTLALGREFRPYKPHPAAALHVMETLKVAPQDTVFIGDGVFDMMCAKGAGCMGILVRNSHVDNPKVREFLRQEEEDRHVTLAFDNLTHVLGYLKDNYA